MGYFLTSAPENAWPAKPVATPKTHTPGLQVQERGQRYYSPTLERWMSRDPVEEYGGYNVYGMVLNAPNRILDYLGLAWVHPNPNWPPVLVGGPRYFLPGEMSLPRQGAGGRGSPQDWFCVGCVANLMAGCAAGCIGKDFATCYRDCVKAGFPNTAGGRLCKCVCDAVSMPPLPPPPIPDLPNVPIAPELPEKTWVPAPEPTSGPTIPPPKGWPIPPSRRKLPVWPYPV